MSQTLSLADLKNLSIEERLIYNKKKNAERQRLFKLNHKDTPEYKQSKKEQTYKYRAENIEIYRALDRKHVQTYRDKKKAINTLTNAIKNMKARRELNILRML